MLTIESIKKYIDSFDEDSKSYMKELVEEDFKNEIEELIDSYNKTDYDSNPLFENYNEYFFMRRLCNLKLERLVAVYSH